MTGLFEFYWADFDVGRPSGGSSPGLKSKRRRQVWDWRTCFAPGLVLQICNLNKLWSLRLISSLTAYGFPESLSKVFKFKWRTVQRWHRRKWWKFLYQLYLKVNEPKNHSIGIDSFEIFRDFFDIGISIPGIRYFFGFLFS